MAEGDTAVRPLQLDPPPPEMGRVNTPHGLGGCTRPLGTTEPLPATPELPAATPPSMHGSLGPCPRPLLRGGGERGQDSISGRTTPHCPTPAPSCCVDTEGRGQGQNQDMGQEPAALGHVRDAGSLGHLDQCGWRELVAL